MLVIGELMKIEDVYFILTADHSTPISVMDHTGDPVPIVINGPEVRVDDVKKFNERSTAKGWSMQNQRKQYNGYSNGPHEQINQIWSIKEY